MATIFVAGIGTVAFDRMMGGVLPGLVETFEDISRPNLDGHAFWLMGQRSEAVRLITAEAMSDGSVNYSLIETKFATYRAMVNSSALATVTDEAGTAYANVRLKNVKPLIMQGGQPYRVLPSGGSGGYAANGLNNPRIIVYAEWEVQVTQ